MTGQVRSPREFRLWNPVLNEYVSNLVDYALLPSGDVVYTAREVFRVMHDFIVEHDTGAYDSGRTPIYEGDVIEVEYYPGLPTTEDQPLVWRGEVRWSYHTGYHIVRPGGGCYAVNYSGSAVKRTTVVGSALAGVSLEVGNTGLKEEENEV